MPPKSTPLTEAAIRRMIKESVDAAIAAERARHANVGNDARCNPATFHGTEGVVELLRWFKKTESVFRISECAEGKKVKFVATTLQGPALTWWNAKVANLGLETMNQMPWTKMKQLMTVEFDELALMCSRMVEPKRVKVDACIWELTDNIKGEVTSSKPANLNKANNQKQRNAQAMVTAPTDGKVILGIDAQGRLSKRKMGKYVVELMLLRIHVKSIKRLDNALVLKTASKTQIESSNTSTEFTEFHLIVLGR
ncbi:hypothetical protein Tco_1507311 [Tanacetum coccineum]